MPDYTTTQFRSAIESMGYKLQSIASSFNTNMMALLRTLRQKIEREKLAKEQEDVAEATIDAVNSPQTKQGVQHTDNDLDSLEKAKANGGSHHTYSKLGKQLNENPIVPYGSEPQMALQPNYHMAPVDHPDQTKQFDPEQDQSVTHRYQLDDQPDLDLFPSLHGQFNQEPEHDHTMQAEPKLEHTMQPEPQPTPEHDHELQLALGLRPQLTDEQRQQVMQQHGQQFEPELQQTAAPIPTPKPAPSKQKWTNAKRAPLHSQDTLVIANQGALPTQAPEHQPVQVFEHNGTSMRIGPKGISIQARDFKEGVHPDYTYSPMLARHRVPSPDAKMLMKAADQLQQITDPESGHVMGPQAADQFVMHGSDKHADFLNNVLSNRTQPYPIGQNTSHDKWTKPEFGAPRTSPQAPQNVISMQQYLPNQQVATQATEPAPQGGGGPSFGR